MGGVSCRALALASVFQNPRQTSSCTESLLSLSITDQRNPLEGSSCSLCRPFSASFSTLCLLSCPRTQHTRFTLLPTIPLLARAYPPSPPSALVVTHHGPRDPLRGAPRLLDLH